MRKSEQDTSGRPRENSGPCIGCLAAVVGLTLLIALRVLQPAQSAAMSQPWLPATPSAERFDSSPYILNALLVPALDADALPLRWVDPRPVMACGPDAAVLVNGEPLQPGALVPGPAFDLEWQTDGCRPFGIHGPSFNGAVKLTVFREDWGFSAIVEPSNLSVGLPESELIAIKPRVATLPQTADVVEVADAAPTGTD